MSITSLQACMDSSNWLQGGAISDDNTGLLMDSSSPITTPTGDDFLPCSGPLVQRRLRPNHDQPLKCPRCESTHTKFCYYNNYNLTQPRYFCKTCRRYWTKGGTLRNIPVGGGCRKNKKVSSNSKKQSTPSSSSDHQNINLHRPFQSQTATDLHLAFPEQLRFSSIHGAGSFNPANTGFLFENMIMNPVECMGMETPIHDNFHGNAYNNNNDIDHHHPFGSSSFEHGTGDMISGGAHHILESYQRLMLPYDDESNHYRYHHLDQNQEVDDDVKPNAKILSLEWHDCNSDAGSKDPFRYNLGGLGSWTGLMSGYGSSATNPLV